MQLAKITKPFLVFWLLSWGYASPAKDELSLPTWDKSVNLKGGFGYKDNVLLSSFNPAASAFTLAGLDLMLWHLPTGNTEFTFFASGEDRRYLSNVPVNKEQSLIAQAQVKQGFGNDWQASLSLQYAYLDQIFDVSTMEADFNTARLKGHGLTARPAVRKDWSTNYYAAVEWTITRQYLASPLDNYWEGGPKLTAGYQYGYGSEIALDVLTMHRIYDERTQTQLNGMPINGTALEFDQPEIELTWRHHLDAQKRWRSTTRIGYEWNLDNSFGYYDYTRYLISQQLRYRRPTWEITLQAQLHLYDFTRRTVSLDDPTKKNIDGLIVNLHGERTLYKSLKLFAEYEFERFLSNQSGYGYTVNTISSGLDWEF